ncbi:DUF3298 and DUF4163 domain-containing protein [Brevibacillus dissolubilis]|uniref:DUF3298 and DUF4163 domain-containing protein n=1 Tax=Brevibacillus dissolubilis TaxID=1844116 RepID=UPI001116D253|nr:DUF3298 and DUF4163 domain-containing protein [Brevibacillus dissolubilis]
MVYTGLSAKISDHVIKRPPVEMHYPVITGLPNQNAERSINQTIRQYAEMIAGQQTDPNLRYFKGTYNIPMNQRGILSIVFTTDSYSGGAHGIQHKYSLNFDLQGGGMFSLFDLFAPNTNWKGRINDYIRRQIQAQQVPMLRPFGGIKDEQPFYLTTNGLGIYFQLYEYTPYAYGFLVFVIPYTLFKGLVDPNGPLMRLMR